MKKLAQQSLSEILENQPSLTAVSAGAKPCPRERLRLDDEWRFHLGEMPGFRKSMPVTQWQWKPYPKPSLTVTEADLPDLREEGEWQNYSLGEDVFQGKPGFAWFKAALPDTPGPQPFLYFQSVDDYATVFVNGKKLLYHEGWQECFEVPLGLSWREGGPNEVVVAVENLPGGIFPDGFIRGVELCSEDSRVLQPFSLDFEDSSWRQVQIPHDFVVEEKFNPEEEIYHGFLPRNTGWYRKVFDLPDTDRGKSLWIEFAGVYRNCKVWLNGRFLGTHLSGYTGFHFDISKAAVFGEKNVLAVHVDARAGEGWWYEGGGIYRHVWLHKSNPLHIQPLGVYVRSQIIGEESAPDEAEIEIQAALRLPEGTEPDCQVRFEIKNAYGKAVFENGQEVKADFPGEENIVQRGRIAAPLLWSLEHPHLYRLVTRIEKDGRVLDETETSFGIRTVRFDADHGVFLNGEPVKIKGTCNHQDFAGLGIALPDRLITYRLEKLKEMGSNAYRCSHHPPAEELLDECDRLGFLVVDENRKLGDSKEILSQVEDMVRRDRNHPSVILWSLCNEESKQGTEEALRMGRKMRNAVLKHDSTRLVTCAMNGGWGGGLIHAVDLMGINYNTDQYQIFHRQHPHQPLFASESASTVSTRGIYQNDPLKGYVSAYDLNHPAWALTAEEAWKAVVRHPYLAGCFVWTGFDYKGEPTPYGWPCVNSHFGIFDICGFPKDNYYYYKAWWTKEPVLHLFPHWNWAGREGEEIDVWCHTNCDRVELFLNNKSLGMKVLEPNGHLEWKVRYEPGTLRAVGLSKGVPIEKEIGTTGVPHYLQLHPYQAEMTADGEDILPVRAEVLDAKGRLVPDAQNLVRFKVVGPARIAGVGNGDPSSLEPDKAEQRKAFNGLCLALVQASCEAGIIRLTAEAEGLQAAEVELRSTVPL